MKKTFKLVDLDCAHCAQKMEDAIQKLDGVQSASISFPSLSARNKSRLPNNAHTSTIFFL